MGAGGATVALAVIAVLTMPIGLAWLPVETRPGTLSAPSVPTPMGYVILPTSNSNPGNNSNGSGTGPFLTFTVVFLEDGLPPGTTWAVRLNGSVETTSGNSLTFHTVAEGSNSFAAEAPSGYSANPSSGTLDVNAPLRIAIGFQSDSGGTLSFWPLAPVEIELIALIAGLGAAGAVASELGQRRRRRRTPDAAGAPPHH
ncbi:MAG TPA: hypothetical protein VGV89_03590 [Thermoplasmata archaeon]|nr:hypothetical protein [Thermoplasmata archaeon]